jgi:hypothetical protein
MALIDSPAAWILRLFEMEEREGRGANCQRFADGFVRSDLPLEPGEKVYGIYRGCYYFTPLAFITERNESYERIRWDAIANVSTHHGSGSKFSTLTLVDGSTTKVRIGDFATGWRGRISQLFHQMIEKWGASATSGPAPLSIEDFFEKASTDYSLAPNLMPHPTLQDMKDALIRLRAEPQVRDVLLRIVDFEGDDPVSDAVVVRVSSSDVDLEGFAEQWGADGVIDAPENVRSFLPDHTGEAIKLIVWD